MLGTTLKSKGWKRGRRDKYIYAAYPSKKKKNMRTKMTTFDVWTTDEAVFNGA